MNTEKNIRMTTPFLFGSVEKINEDIKSIDSHLNILRSSLAIKERIIDMLQKELENKNKTIESQMKFIDDLEMQLSMFYRVLVGLKDAKNRKQVAKILAQYSINLDLIPSLQ